MHELSASWLGVNVLLCFVGRDEPCSASGPSSCIESFCGIRLFMIRLFVSGGAKDVAVNEVVVVSRRGSSDSIRSSWWQFRSAISIGNFVRGGSVLERGSEVDSIGSTSSKLVLADGSWLDVLM